MTTDRLIDSPDDFAATDPDEVVLTRRRLLRSAGLLTLGGLGATVLSDDAFGVARKSTKRTTKKTTAKTRTTTTTPATSTTPSTTAAPSTTIGVTTTTPASAVTGSCTLIPSETGGPYPGDGSNGVNILTENGVVRSDIRSSFGSSTATAKGVPLTLRFALRSLSKGCAPVAGAAFYAWHCDRDGNYSLYSSSVVSENYLRGVQGSDADGIVTFQTIFPGAYMGRWPHVHFEVYPSLAQATTSRNAVLTSQLALPQASCESVYATAGYETSARNFPQTPLSRDNVFSDGWTTQLGTVTGDVVKGLVCTLTVTY